MWTIQVHVVPMVLVILEELRWVMVTVMKPRYGLKPGLVLIWSVWVLLQLAMIYAAGWGICWLVNWLAG